MLAQPPQTARELIAAIVLEQVAAFRERREESELLQILTPDKIAEGCEAGRIVSGAQDPDPRIPDSARAIEAAMQAFEDGLYFLFLGDVQVETLDAPLRVQSLSDVLFVRLTPLAGG
jgi:hypothetical protein